MARHYYSYEEKHRTVNGVKQKRCTKCKKWKEESEFCKDRNSKDGLRIWCRDCDRARDQERYKKDRKHVKEHLKYEERHRIVNNVKQKLCCRCRKWKNESQYCRSDRSKDGLQWQCKECESKYTREYYKRKTQNKATNKAHKKRRLAVRN